MKAIALCSCPRLGYMDFMGASLAAFATNGVTYRNLFGVFWSQAMSNGIKAAVDEGYDYIITTDYDSVFSAETVAQLIKLAHYNPHADAITTIQMGRFGGLLATTESGEIARKELATEELIPVSTAHFGLTLIKASAINDLMKPWFWSKPDGDDEWKRGSDKIDEDIYFWDNFKKSGKKLFLAPRLTIGHLELLIKWPDQDMQGIYETLGHYHEYGPPADVWK